MARLSVTFVFGMLLGITGVVGYLTHLPLDIRHVAFSSANVGYIAVSGQFTYSLLLQCIGFVLLIGLVNLIVSFFINTLGCTAFFECGN